MGVRRQARGPSYVITPLKASSLKNTVETTFLYDDKTKKKAYSISAKQQTMTSSTGRAWADAGFKESTFDGWKAYWILVRQVQPRTDQDGKRTYAIWQPIGVDSSDSFYSV